MINFIISSESTCDLTKEQVLENDFRTAFVHFMVDEIEYDNGEQLSAKQLCDKMQKGATTKTFQINEYTAREYFEELLKEGKDVVHLSFSSRQSGTCSNFIKASEALNKEQEEKGLSNRVYVVDTLCQSAGVGLLLMLVKKKAEENNLTAKEACEYAEKVKLSIAHVFIVDTLKYLSRGGRVSAPAAFFGNVLTIKPILRLNEEGVIVPFSKVLGRKRSIIALLDKFKKDYDQEYGQIIICHSDCEEEAEGVKQKINEIAPNLDISVQPLGPTIISHCGPGVIAIFFTAKNR